MLWDEIIEPHLVTNEAHIDTNIKKAREKVFSKVVQFSKYGLGFTQRMVLNGWLEGQVSWSESFIYSKMAACECCPGEKPDGAR